LTGVASVNKNLRWLTISSDQKGCLNNSPLHNKYGAYTWRGISPVITDRTATRGEAANQGGNSGGNGNKGGREQGPPDLDDIFRKLSKKLGGLGGGKGSGSGGNALRAAPANGRPRSRHRCRCGGDYLGCQRFLHH
jgi:hypothetical protein